MLGRKQSLKGEPVLADYGPEECLNESADIEWVNKVEEMKNWVERWLPSFASLSHISYDYVIPRNFFSVMGAQADEVLRSRIAGLCLPKYTKDFRKGTSTAVCHLCVRFGGHISFYCRDDCQDAHSWHTEGQDYCESYFYY